MESGAGASGDGLEPPKLPESIGYGGQAGQFALFRVGGATSHHMDGTTTTVLMEHVRC